jgi:Alpha/beta hydrolase family
MSYFDKKTFATDEAVIVGRLHCLRDGWSDALVSFMQSGGFSPSAKIPLVAAPALVLWGRQDGILDGNEFAPKFIETLPNARLQWIENCGHVPHLEQPDETASAIADFVQSTIQHSSSKQQDRSDSDRSFQNQLIGAAGLGVTALAALAADFLPVH